MNARIETHDETPLDRWGYDISPAVAVLSFFALLLVGWMVTAYDLLTSSTNQLRFYLPEDYQRERDLCIRGGILFTALVGLVAAYFLGYTTIPPASFWIIAGLIAALNILQNVDLHFNEEAE